MTKQKKQRTQGKDLFQVRSKGAEKKAPEAWHQFIEAEILDKLVADGLFRVVGIRADGRKVYASNEDARSQHHAPKKRQ